MRFSVVVATCNRPAVLARTLDCLTAGKQGLAADAFETIVTDDSRDDATERMVRSRYPDVRYVRGPGRGPAANRNRGAAEGHAEWIAFIDDDCAPVDGWLRALEQADADRAPDVIEGRIVSPDKTDNPFRRHGENLTGGVFWTGNLAIRRQVFNRLGGFDEDFGEAGEDMELGYRITQAGLPTMFCPAATVIHPSHSVGLWHLVRRSFQIRWHLLYVLKTHQGVSLDASPWAAAVGVIVGRTMMLLRRTSHAVGPSHAGQRKSAIFAAGLGWMMFPILLPYMVYWDFQFRRMLRAQSRESPAAVQRAATR